MTRAQRWRKRERDAKAHRPSVKFSGVEVTATMEGVRFGSSGGGYVEIDDARIPALTKFLREYFVRRDK